MNKHEHKLLKLNSKAQDCISREKARKILHKFNKTTAEISGKFEKDSEIFLKEIMPYLEELGLLHPDPQAFGGAHLIDSVNRDKFKITGTEDVNRLQKAREFMNTILGIMGSKGQFEINPSIKPKEVNILSVEKFMENMNANGLNTDISALRIFSREAIRDIIKERISNSNLTDGDANSLIMMMQMPGKLVKYRTIGTEAAVGFTVHKMKIETTDQEISNAVTEYNKMVDGFIERGRAKKGDGTLVKPEKEIILLEGHIAGEQFKNAFELLKADIALDGKFTRDSLNELITLIEGPVRLRDALAIANRENPDKVYEMVQMLEMEGIIEKNFR